MNLMFNLRAESSIKVYILVTPIITLFGLVSNFINIIVFSNSKLKDSSYRLMLADSVIHFVYLVFTGCGAAFYCVSICEVTSSYANKFFQLYFTDYLTSSLAIYSIFVEIYLSLQRLFIISNKKTLQNLSHKIVLSILFVLSLLFYMPNIFLKNIVSVERGVSIQSIDVNVSYSNKTVSFSLTTSIFGKSIYGKIIPVILTSIRIFLSIIVLSLINILTAIKFKKHFNRKYYLKAATITNFRSMIFYFRFLICSLDKLNLLKFSCVRVIE